MNSTNDQSGNNVGKNILIAVIVLIPIVLFSLDEFNVVLTEVGQDVPKFKSVTIDNEIFDIEDYKGKIVIINLFASYCLPCKPELKSLEEDIWLKYRDLGVVVLGVGKGDDTATLKKLKSEMGLSFPIIADTSKQISNLFAKKYIPRNFLVDRKGKIFFQTLGFDDIGHDDLNANLQNLLH